LPRSIDSKANGPLPIGVAPAGCFAIAVCGSASRPARSVIALGADRRHRGEDPAAGALQAIERGGHVLRRQRAAVVEPHALADRDAHLAAIGDGQARREVRLDDAVDGDVVQRVVDELDRGDVGVALRAHRIERCRRTQERRVERTAVVRPALGVRERRHADEREPCRSRARNLLAQSSLHSSTCFEPTKRTATTTSTGPLPLSTSAMPAIPPLNLWW
jgi:hypothetical protein